jgi:general secretion pathway protein G
MNTNVLRTPCQRRQGFTLLELMVVMFILVMLAGAVTVMVTNRLEDAKHGKAVTDVEQIKAAISHYLLNNNSYPPDLNALYTKPTGQDLPNWAGPYVEKPVPNDPWGRPYIYVYPGVHNPESYDISCLGKSGKEGGTGNDAEICNWPLQ